MPLAWLAYCHKPLSGPASGGWSLNLPELQEQPWSLWRGLSSIPKPTRFGGVEERKALCKHRCCFPPFKVRMSCKISCGSHLCAKPQVLGWGGAGEKADTQRQGGSQAGLRSRHDYAKDVCSSGMGEGSRINKLLHMITLWVGAGSWWGGASLLISIHSAEGVHGASCTYNCMCRSSAPSIRDHVFVFGYKFLYTWGSVHTFSQKRLSDNGYDPTHLSRYLGSSGFCSLLPLF